MKIDQIAFGCDSEMLWGQMAEKASVTDHVIFRGHLKDYEKNDMWRIEGRALLAFDYEGGVEREYLYYPEHWNSFHRFVKNRTGLFLSHLASHVDSIEYYLRGNGGSETIVMDITTTEHSNPKLKELGRTYRYVIMDWRKTHGYFYKLIQRIEKP